VKREGLPKRTETEWAMNGSNFNYTFPRRGHRRLRKQEG
jgi:hypothetical protein